MSASDPILWLDINLSKILLATLNPKNSYYNYILVVYVQYVIFPKCIMYFWYYWINFMQILDLC